jgi:hypothetical protein
MWRASIDRTRYRRVDGSGCFREGSPLMNVPFGQIKRASAWLRCEPSMSRPLPYKGATPAPNQRLKGSYGISMYVAMYVALIGKVVR